MEASVRREGQRINNLQYTGDTTLLAGKKENMILINIVKYGSEKAGLSLHLRNIIVMSNGKLVNIFVNDEEVSTVQVFRACNHH
jgi:hypothetical protein